MELSSPISIVKGLGPTREDILNQQGIYTISDILYHFPRKHLDRTVLTPIKKLVKGNIVNVFASVETYGYKSIRQGKIFQVIVSDRTGILTLSWFNGGKYIRGIIKKGQKLAIFGKVDWYQGFVMTHPEFEILDDKDETIISGGVVPIYPLKKEFLSAGLGQRRLRVIIKTILESKLVISEIFSKSILKQYNLISLEKAFNHIHFPDSLDDLHLAKRRLKFDEHFFLQLLVALKKKELQSNGTRALPDIGPYFNQISQSLDFDLTKAQKRVIQEIHKDLKLSRPMNRLIQGDVGCGKTIVAILVSALATGNNIQVGVLAPTEILAGQHFLSFKREFDKVNIPCSLLVGKMKKADRLPILNGLGEGKISVAIGTHALIQDDVVFNKLGLVIIDEQHRFGVNQRMQLLKKGENPHLMSMTATPIPRTLAITYHGDMDLSIIDELPSNRIPVKTKVIDPIKIDKVYKFIKDKIFEGRQCIIVYPLVEESEKSDLAASVEAHKKLSTTHFINIETGLLHGKMKSSEKQIIIKDFNENKIKILISTTVVEVGIDVPNATVMLVEHAERFGLTQLHQLRGRVGRGSKKSYCILVKRNISNVSKTRLNIMEQTNDGFKIADADLKLRGPGEVFGLKQSGFFQYKIANLINDSSIIKDARDLAFKLVESDPNLTKPSNKEIKKIFKNQYKKQIKHLNLI